MEVYLNQKKIRLSPKKSIGKGGEADVFKINKRTALKLFKSATHPDYANQSHAQQAAQERLDLHQSKLRQFPQSLPPQVIVPQELVTDRTGTQILGYTMQLLEETEVLLKYSNRSFRKAVTAQTVVQIFQNLHNTLSKLHFAAVIIGDFNDLNILVKGTTAYLIDADSFQFGAYPCQMFSARFVDPLLCNAQANQPILQRPHSVQSDWYAFTVMLMQCLLFVDPYGGIYKPKPPHRPIPQAARPLRRITVFHPEVRYPKPALPYSILPDDLLHHFHQVFEKDWRGEFPQALLENLRWTTCLTCGQAHARATCPQCRSIQGPRPERGHSPLQRETSSPIKQGTVTVTQLFKTEGVILFATQQQGQLQWIYWESVPTEKEIGYPGQFKRETGSVLLTGELTSQIRWRIQGSQTLVGGQGQVVAIHSGTASPAISTDNYQGVTQFDVNATHRYWTGQGQLFRETVLGNQVMGNILAGGQTQIWVGPTFGFGFYQAGNLKVAFVFDAERSGINDRVQLPHWQGALVNMNGVFSNDRCWLFLTVHDQGIFQYHGVVIAADGSTIAQTHTTEVDHWLAGLGKVAGNDPCPHCAVHDFLLAATDDGIVRVETQHKQLIKTKVFSETESFVAVGDQLLAAPEGLYVVGQHQIQLLKLG